MKILIFNWRDIRHPWAGGSEINVHEMAKIWVRYGHEVTMVCATHYGDGETKSEEIIDGIRVIRIGGRYTLYLLAPFYYLFKLRTWCDVIIDVENGIPFFTPLFSRKPKCCLVNHVHKDVFFTEMKFPLSIIGYFIETRVMPFLYKGTSFVVISKTTHDQLAGIGIDKSHIRIVYAGLDHSIYRPGGKKFKNPTIIYLGRLRKYKRVGLLIDLCKDIFTRVPNARLLIAGAGDDLIFVKEKVKKMHLDRKIKILGYVDLRRKVELLRGSWVYITPSSIEGWGLSVLEANACGTPALSFKVPGLSEAIKDGYSGLLANTNKEMVDNVTTLLNNKVLRDRLERGALQRALEFNWDRSASRFLQIMLGVVPINEKRNSKYGNGYFSNLLRGAYRRKFHPIYDFRSWYIRKKLKPKKILDVGCGTGVIAVDLLKNGINTRGVDISKVAIKLIPEKYRKYFSLGNLLNLKFKDNSFDTVVCIDVLEHIPRKSLSRAINELARVSSKKIYFDITVLEDILFIFADSTHVSKFFSWEWGKIIRNALGENWKLRRGPILPLIHHGIFIAEKIR